MFVGRVSVPVRGVPFVPSVIGSVTETVVEVETDGNDVAEAEASCTALTDPSLG
jgi:hypothetical protein